MKNLSSSDLIRMIESDGWYEVRHKGSHKHFRHPEKKGLVTIPHPRKSFPPKTIKSVLHVAGLDREE